MLELLRTLALRAPVLCPEVLCYDARYRLAEGQA